MTSFDRTAAEGYAAQIATRYPSDADWHAAKRERCATRFHVAADAGAACPATVDWFIAGSHPTSGDGGRVIVVTDDAGVEYEGGDVLSLDQAIELAEALPTRNGDVDDKAT